MRKVTYKVSMQILVNQDDDTEIMEEMETEIRDVIPQMHITADVIDINNIEIECIDSR